MKIVFLAKYLPAEGSTINMYELAALLTERGHEIHLISSEVMQDKLAINLFNKAVKNGLIYHKVGFPNTININFFGKIKQALKYALSTPKALFLLYRIKPDVIHVHYPVTSYIAFLYRKLTGQKFITTHHTTNIPHHFLHKKADYVVAISNELREELMMGHDYSNEQVKVIFNGVSREKYDPIVTDSEVTKIKEDLNIPLDKIIIGFVGRLIYDKGIDILLKAIKNLNNEHIHLVLLGAGSRDKIIQFLKENDLESKVSIFSPQDSLPFYKMFDIFVLPSRQEGFSLVILEAMMMGLPTITSDVGGARDQINHGTDGLIFQKENVEELRDYLQMLIEDEKLRDEIAKKGNQKAHQNFTNEIMIDKLLDVYKLTT